jgi:general secretion pathway protein B
VPAAAAAPAPPAPSSGAPVPASATPQALQPAVPTPLVPAGSDDIERLPTAQDLMAAGITLPALQLNLHVYDAMPVNRYVLLNSVRLREGEFTPDGIKVERITVRGVVLEAGGRRFLLVAGG